MRHIRNLLLLLLLAAPAVSGWQEWSELGDEPCPRVQDVLDESDGVRLTCTDDGRLASRGKRIHLFRVGSEEPWFTTAADGRSVTLTFDRAGSLDSASLDRALKIVAEEELFGGFSRYDQEGVRSRIRAALKRHLERNSTVVVRLETDKVLVQDERGGPVVDRIAL